MHRSARPVRNIALWLLALFSGALSLLGAWVILDRLPGMEAVLDDGTATGAQVYGGQSWVVVGAAVLTAGLIGLALTLAVAARSARVPIDTPDAGTGAAAADPGAVATTGEQPTDIAPQTVPAGDATPALR